MDRNFFGAGFDGNGERATQKWLGGSDVESGFFAVDVDGLDVEVASIQVERIGAGLVGYVDGGGSGEGFGFKVHL